MFPLTHPFPSILSNNYYVHREIPTVTIYHPVDRYFITVDLAFDCGTREDPFKRFSSLAQRRAMLRVTIGRPVSANQPFRKSGSFHVNRRRRGHRFAFCFRNGPPIFGGRSLCFTYARLIAAGFHPVDPLPGPRGFPRTGCKVEARFSILEINRRNRDGPIL